MSKKIFVKTSIIILISILLITVSSNCFAEGFYVGMSLYGQTNAEEGETINLYLDIDEIDAGNGIDGISAKLSFDSSVFEYASVTGVSGWNVSYAPSTGNIVALRNSKVTGSCGFLSICLKARNNIDLDYSTVTVRNIVASGGIIENGGTDDINVSSVSTGIEIIREVPVQNEDVQEEDGFVEEDEDSLQEFQERDIQQTSRSIEMADGENESNIVTEENKQEEQLLEEKIPEGLQVSDKIKVAKASEGSSSSIFNDTQDSNGNKRNIRIAATVILVTIVIIAGYVLIKKANRMMIR